MSPPIEAWKGMSPPAPGQVVQVRSRRHLVESVEPAREPAWEQTRVDLSCLEDDAQGERLAVLWEREVDAQVLPESDWKHLASKGFDAPHVFSAYLHALRWNLVTSTNPRLFQSPHRAGIQIMSYQLEPLKKALQMPRVNLFIADDVGLGKTIEAGLILREMIMRQKVKRIVIACPASLVSQWQSEMEARFGLTFVIFDRDYLFNCRRERGYAINPWTTHSQFIVSHSLLRDEQYASPLRDWLGSAGTDGRRSGSMLVLDEAHHAAPATSSSYAIDSQFTRGMRELTPLFEHRLFLSATPHNGHSNSFSALLAMLDPQRFIRGEQIKDPRLLDQVMVRRLKDELREAVPGLKLPKREVVQHDISGLPDDAPDLALMRLLTQYRGPDRWRFPEIHGRAWFRAMDALRAPKPKDQDFYEWRASSPIRPIVFQSPTHIDESVVHMHLEHRVVQRLLGRLRAQGFVHNDLARACVGQTDDAIRRVVLLGRISLYGPGASRLHDEIIAVAARWIDPIARKGPLEPYKEDTEKSTLAALEKSFESARDRRVDEAVERKLQSAAPLDVADLLPHLRSRAATVRRTPPPAGCR